MKAKLKILIVLLCVVAMAAPGCKTFGMRWPIYKKPEPAPAVQPIPLTNEDLVVADENRLTTKQTKMKRIFPEEFAVTSVPCGEEMFVYKVVVKDSSVYDGKVDLKTEKYQMLFELGRLNREIMGYGRIIKNVDGVSIVLRAPDKLIKGAKGVQCVMEVHGDEVANWKKILPPKPVRTDPNDPNSVFEAEKDYEIVEIECDKLPVPPRPSIFRGTELYTVRSDCLRPSAYFSRNAKAKAIVKDGKVHILDPSCLKFTNKEIVAD